MKCPNCNSTMIRFVDGFGQKRVYCKRCYISFVEDYLLEFGIQKTISNFVYSNPKAIARIRRWR